MPRFMMIMKGNQASESGQLPSEEILDAMGRYNEELQKAGMLIDLAGLHPRKDGARVKLSPDGTRTVMEGGSESDDILAGYWLIQAKSLEEAIDWAKRVPSEGGEEYGEGEIEIRQVFELDEFGDSPAIDRARDLEQKLTQQEG